MKNALLALMTAGTLFVPAPVLAQEADNVGHGRQIAQTICIACHVVAKDQRVHPTAKRRRFP
jgi:mono/diheme cytochrome c family protein